MPAKVPLKDLCELITKGTTPTSIGLNLAEKGIPFLRVQNISGGRVNFNNDTLFIDEQVHQALKRSHILPGDVLLSIAGSIGRTGAYTLDEAVADGHLVPPVPISVPLKFMRKGVNYDDLNDEEKEEWDALEWYEDGTTPKEVDSAALNQWLFNQDTVDKVLEHLMTHGIKVAAGDRLGKTIIFAKNNAHAEFIEERFNENYPQYKGHFSRVITYQTKYAQSLIDDFSKKDKMPHIAISVDMLDTGIDVPEVVNLVFFKMVRTKTKFWQMVGRGTRLCPHLFGPDDHKKNFFIFDYCQNLEFFSKDQNFSEGSTAESLSTRLFKGRLNLIAELDKKLGPPPGVPEPPAPYAGQPEDSQLRQELADMLNQTVAAMNVDNFVVRPKRQWVEKFAKPTAWSQLDPEAFHELGSYVASLPSEMTDEDEEAKRFDMLVLRTQLAVLQAKPDFASLKERIVSLAVALEALHSSIPAVRQEIVLIQALTSEEWWEDVTVPMLETVRKKLRALIKLIPKGENKVVYTNFEDTLGEHAVIDLPQVTAGLNMAKFKEKARHFLKAHESHLALQRLRRNQPLTPSDLSELEKMLVEAGGSPELINEAKEKSHGLGLFIRSLVGLDREAAKQAFSEFISGMTATADQIEFTNLIVEELTLNGFMAPERLFEAPFTNISARGPLGIFPPAQVKQMVQVLNDIRERAAA